MLWYAIPWCTMTWYRCLCKKNTPSEKQRTKSGGGEQFMLPRCKAKALVKGTYFHRHRHDITWHSVTYSISNDTPSHAMTPHPPNSSRQTLKLEAKSEIIGVRSHRAVEVWVFVSWPSPHKLSSLLLLLLAAVVLWVVVLLVWLVPRAKMENALGRLRHHRRTGPGDHDSNIIS